MDITAVKLLRDECAGDVILPGDELYEQVRTSYVYKGTPAVVVRVQSAQDVAAALRFARKHEVSVAVRSGGHSVSGLSTNDGGMIIDLSAMNTIQVVDHQQRHVRIGAGATWKMVADELQKHGLALSSGDSTSVGVGGLVLGGGVGWMVRKYGLTIDHLQTAEIVTADGQIIHTSATDHPDLFWAIRGGGGNFGVVTYCEFTAAPVTEVYSGMIIYALDDIASLLKKWRDHMRGAPDDLTVMFLLMPAFLGNPPSAIAWCCYSGNDEAGMKKAIDPLLRIGTVLQNNVILKPYAAVLEEPHPPEGVKVAVNNGFVRDFSDELILAIASTHGKETSPVLQLRSVGGAMNRIDPSATAFAHRSSEVLMISAAFMPMDASEAQEREAMIPWRTIAPFTSGAYVNFFSTVTADDVAACYPKSVYERLAAVKAQYDPQNVFHRNYNVKPAGSI